MVWCFGSPPAMNLPHSQPANPAPSDEARWFAEAVQPHDGEVRGFLRRRFPAITDVDDLMQEAYARIWRARTLGAIDNPRAFLFQIVRNLAHDHYRRESRNPPVPITDLEAARVFDEEPSAAEHASREQERQILLAAVRALPDRCREVVLLRYMEGLSYKEIAIKLNISPETVKVHLAKGLQRCQAYFRNDERKPV
jgi:RNA polymerase sigma-70 factor (ECF subfamily)